MNIDDLPMIFCVVALVLGQLYGYKCRNIWIKSACTKADQTQFSKKNINLNYVAMIW